MRRVMVARVDNNSRLCRDPIGTPESLPQSAAERRTANKCCQTPKQDFSPDPIKPDFSPAGKRISFDKDNRICERDTSETVSKSEMVMVVNEEAEE